MIRSTLGRLEVDSTACEFATLASKPAAPLRSKSLRVSPFIKSATELEPAEFGNSIANRFVFLDEREHAVFGLVELLGFLQHLGRILAGYDDHPIQIGNNDVS